MKKFYNLRSLIILSISLVFIIICTLCFTLITSSDTVGNLYYVFSYLFIFIVTLYYSYALYRIEDGKLKKIAFAIVFLDILFIFLQYLNNLSTGLTFSRYVFYFYFLPVLFIPILLFIFVNEVFNLFNKNKVNRIIYTILTCISGLFFILITTNDAHQLLYKIPSNYYQTHGRLIAQPLYYIMCGYCLGICCLAVIAFIIKTLRRNNIVQLIAPILIFLAFIFYAILYIKDYLENVVILNDAPLVFNILFIILFEILLSNGLIQNNGQYLKIFNECMLPLKIIDNTDDDVYSSSSFDENTYYLQDDDNKIFESKDINGGKIVIEEDISKIKELRDQLNKSIAELNNANNILLQKKEVEEESVRIKVRNELYNEIDKAIYQKSKEIDVLVSLLPDDVNDDNRKMAIDGLARIRLRIGYLKQKCLLILQSKMDNKLLLNEFKISVNVIVSDLKNIGLANFAYVIQGKKSVPTTYALAFNELMEIIGENFANLDCDVFVTINLEQLKCLARVATESKVLIPKTNNFIKNLGYDFKVKKSLDEYLLSIEEGSK